MQIIGQKCRWRGVNIGEVATAAAGNANLFCRPFGMIENQDRPATVAGNAATHQPGSPAANDHNIACFTHHITRSPGAILLRGLLYGV